VTTAVQTGPAPGVQVLGRTVGPLVLVAAALTAGQLALRAWIGYQGYFSLDDFVFYTKAAELPPYSPHLLFDAYNGHLMPGAMLWAWAVTRAVPLGFGLVMTTCLVLQAAVDVAFLVLLRRLFGNRMAVLLPYALFLFTTISLPATLWWAAALNQLPQQLFTILALIAHLSFVRTHKARPLVLAVLSLLGGLAFSEKTAFAAVLMAAVTWLFCTPGSLGTSLVAAVRRHWVAWTAYTAVLLPYLVYYQREVSTPVRDGAGARQAVDLFDVMLRRAILPGLIGGPWTWEPIGWVDSLANPPVLAQVLAAVVVGVFVVATIKRRVNAYRAWLLAGAYLLLVFVVLLITRVQVTGVAAVGAEYRYYTDFALVAALTAGLATLRTRPEVVAGGNGQPVLGRIRPLTETPLETGVPAPFVAGLVVAALAASSAYSAYTFGERWRDNQAKPYLANARQAIGKVGLGAVIYDGPVPSEVVWRLLWPANLPTHLLGPLGLNAKPMAEGVATRRLLEFSQQGRLQDSRVSGPYSTPGQSFECGWRVPAEPTRIPLESKLFFWNWVAQFDLVVRNDTMLTIRAGKTRAQVPVKAGQRRLYLGVSGEIDSLVVERAAGGPAGGPAGGADVCVKSVVVGLPQPAAW